MQKTSPLFTATAASAVYFIVFIIIKYLLENGVLDWKSALSGAIVFWFVMFLIHQLVNRRHVEY